METLRRIADAMLKQRGPYEVFGALLIVGLLASGAWITAILVALSGATVRRGRITRTGNALARSMLIEASWSYRHPAREGRRHLERAGHLPERIRDIGWKAQTRLCGMSGIDHQRCRSMPTRSSLPR